ncbi:tRNA-dihydrouridine synthase [Candidatus Kaiserbacteria bacterium]|nr:tRNA-dihydrouridine synthase [Candidatus Kaiserbacteria bacterium]
MQSFWEKLPKPFFALAPMADVTDAAFRPLIAKYGKPDVLFTEFVSADGLFHTRERAKVKDEENPLMRDVKFSEIERPIVMQIFSGKPAMIAYGAKLAQELGFDGVDINMGCPDRTIEKQSAGAALIKHPELALELIRAAQEASPLPVSVKTRVGYHYEILDEWIPLLLSGEPSAIAIHLRTRKEMSSVPADWGLMKRAVALRDRAGSKTLMIGNGDVKDLEEARVKAAESGADGVMLGRAIFGNPWLFSGRPASGITPAEKLVALAELAHNFEKLSPPKSFATFKKHIKAFVSGWPEAAELRTRLMDVTSAEALSAVVQATGLDL